MMGIFPLDIIVEHEVGLYVPGSTNLLQVYRLNTYCFKSGSTPLIDPPYPIKRKQGRCYWLKRGSSNER